MASILDLAVVALALAVCGTIGLLAWTLGITIPAALRRSRRDIFLARLQAAIVERRLRRHLTHGPIRPDGTGGNE